MAIMVFNGEQIEIDVGETLFQAADRSAQGVHEIASSCKRRGACKECIVQIKRGNDELTPWSEHEEFLQLQSDSEGQIFRLACQAQVAQADAIIEVETFKRRLEIADTGRPAEYDLDPWVQREGSDLYCDGRKLAEHAGPIHGLAVDLGTSTVVMHLVDLGTGDTLAVQAFENPQKYAGSDIMHRISYDRDHPGRLQRTIIAQVNKVLRELPVDCKTIFAVTVAGNPTMRDVFFGIDVQSIGQSPFVSRTEAELLAGKRESTAIWSDAKDLHLSVHPQAQVYGLPLASNHVGADMAAVLVTIPIADHQEPFMVIDIGTNSEVVIGNRDRLICASCPAGPAFEGGRLGCGMVASDGAITEIRRRGDDWAISSIGSGPVRGFCGSGLVDLLAELLASEQMDLLGRFSDGSRQIAICDQPPLHFTGSDASELAQAKAANGLGQAVLLRKFGITVSELGTYYLAGAFANKIDLARAQQIGLLLPVPDERVVRIGNASVEGAKAALLSRACREKIESLVRRIDHVELEKEPDFFEMYAEMTQFEPINGTL